MVGRRLVRTGAVVGVIGVLAGCGSSSGTDPDVETAVFEPESVPLEDLPPAEGRMGFAISEDAAIVGGGAVQADSDDPAVPHGAYSSVDGLWILGPEDTAETLPQLDAEGIVLGLSGTQVDDTIVISAMECPNNVSGTGGVPCVTPRKPVVWTMDRRGTRWERHEFPTEVEASWSSNITTGGGHAPLVFGQYDGLVYIAMTSDELTRFSVFDPSEGSFALVGDGPPTARNYTRGPFCLTDKGDILQLRVPMDEDDPQGTTPLNEALVARLDVDGGWTEGPTFPLVEGPLGRPSSISCLPEDQVLVSLPTAGSDSLNLDADEDPNAIEVTSLDSQSLELQNDPDLDEVLDELRAGAPNGSAGSYGEELLVQVSGNRLVTVADNGSIAAFEDIDAIPGRSLVVYGNRIGTVDHFTGEVNAS